MVNGHHGAGGDEGVTDMVTISNIDEHVINSNLKKRYAVNKIYVSIMINNFTRSLAFKNPLHCCKKYFVLARGDIFC